MSALGPNLLTDTLNLIALARETALAGGDQARAEKLAALVSELRNLAAEAHQGGSATPPPEGPVQGDFRAIFEAAQAVEAVAEGAPTPGNRLQLVAAMAAGGAAEVEIARRLGMAREEVRLMLSLKRARPGEEMPSLAAGALSGHSQAGEAAAGAAQAPGGRRREEEVDE